MAKFVLTAQLQLQAPRNVAAVARQIQTQLNNIKVNVAVTGASTATSNLKKVEASANKAGSAASRMGRAFAVSIKRFAAFSIATRAVGLFTRSLGNAVREAIAFERELIKVSQVTGKSMKDLRGLTDEITRLATSMGVASKSLISVSRVLSQAGLSARETQTALATLARTELAPTFENITQTAEGAIAIFNQFGKGAEALERQLGAINAVAGKFAVEAGDLISVVRRTGGVFKSAGGSLNELIALFTSVRSTTRESAESIATGLRTIFTRIQRPKTIEFLKQYGVELLDLEGKFVGPFEAVRRLSGAMQGLEEGDITFVKIAEQLGGFRQIGKVLPLLQQFAVAQDALSVAQKGGTSLTDDAAKAQAALAVRITKVKEEFMALIREFTQTKTFQLMVGTALALASALIRIASAAKELLPILAALMAMRMGRGMMGFVGGLKGGMKGAVPMMGMARGGLVPGSGNRDTVPAVLTPGEFVVRKQSVNAIGAGNLEGMNRYAAGGKVGAGRHAYGATPTPTIRLRKGAIGGFFLRPSKGEDRDHQFTKKKILVTNPQSAERLKGKKGMKSRAAGASASNKQLGAHLGSMTQKEQHEAGLIGKTQSKIDARGASLQMDKRRDPKGVFRGRAGRLYGHALVRNKVTTGSQKFNLRGTASGFFPGKDELGTSKIGNIVAAETKKGLKKTIKDTVKRIRKDKLIDVSPINSSEKTVFDSAMSNLFKAGGAQDAVEGYVLEGLISAVTNAKLAGGGTRFDFPANSLGKPGGRRRQRLGEMFGAKGKIQQLIKADAKRTANAGNWNSIADKLTADINKGDLKGIMGFAKGGSVADTVPALLTPGEFVVNKKSSQAIGYGNLSNMNRYAAGGKVGAKRHAYGAAPSGGGGQGGMGGMGMMMPVMMAGMVQGMVDVETTTGKVVHRLTSMVMQLGMVVMALQMFGVSLTKASMMNMMRGKMPGGGSIAERVKGVRNAPLIGPLPKTSYKQVGGKFIGVKARPTVNTGMMGKGGVIAKISGPASKAAAGLASMVGPILVAGLAFHVLGGILDDYLGYEKKRKKAIEEGNITQAEAASSNQSAQKSMTKLSYGLIAGGAAIGAFAGPPGAAIGAAIGAVAGFGLKIALATGAIDPDKFNDFMHMLGMGESSDLIKQRAKVATMEVSTGKSLVKAGEAAAKALERVRAGAITATEALADPALDAARTNVLAMNKEREVLEQKNTRDNIEGMVAGGAVRNFFTLGGLMGEGASEKRERVREENKKSEEARKASAQDIMTKQMPLMQARMRSVAAGGGDEAAFFATMDEHTKKLMKQAGMTEQVTKSFRNVKREADLLRDKIAALNLGMRDMTGRVGATAAGMDYLMDRFKTGGMTLESSVNLIAAAMTEAGAHISEADFGKALKDVEKNFAAFGAGETELRKFTESMRATHTIQQNMDEIFNDDFKQGLEREFKAGKVGGGASDDLRGRMADVIVKQLEEKGFSKDIQAQFRKIIESGQLSPEEMAKLGTGNVSVVTKLWNDLTKKQVDMLKDTSEKLAGMNKQLESLTKDRISAERAFIAAQRTSIDMQMEARKIAAKYGGAKFGTDEKRRLLLEKANIGARGMGVSNLRGGGVGELRRRNAQIGMNFANIEQARRRTDAGGEEMRGVKGQELKAKQDDLMKANKDHANLIRSLIKLEEEELQILEKKNALEKDSLSSLMKGDLAAFLDQQAAVGATAAIATGDRGMMGMFGADALAGAFENIKKQQEGGVQSLYGQKLGGAGGLAERGAQAALGARGLTDLHSAQIAAGTTPAEEAKKRNIRGLAGELAATGDVGAAMTGMKVGTAEMRIDLAHIEIVKLQERGKEILGTGLSRGGLIYANNGVFVPRGTDTVPAMLTPGEFVVRRQAVQRGNNLQMLQAMNGGEAGRYQYGGQVEYLHGGGRKGGGRGGASVGLDPNAVANLATSLSMFNSGLADNIQKLKDIQFQIKLDTTNINVTLNGASFLASLSGALKSELMVAIGQKIGGSGFNSDGSMMATTGPLRETGAVG